MAGATNDSQVGTQAVGRTCCHHLPLFLRPLGSRLTDGSIISYLFDKNIYKTAWPSLIPSIGLSTGKTARSSEPDEILRAAYKRT